MQKKKNILFKLPKTNHQKVALIILILLLGQTIYAISGYKMLFYNFDYTLEEIPFFLFNILFGLAHTIMWELIFASPACIFLFTKEFKKNISFIMLFYIATLTIILISTMNNNGFAFIEALLYTTPILIGISILLLILRKKNTKISK